MTVDSTANGEWPMADSRQSFKSLLRRAMFCPYEAALHGFTDLANDTKKIHLDPTEPTGHEAVVDDVDEGDTADESVPRRCTRCGDMVPHRFVFCGACGFNLTGPSERHAFRDPLIGAVIGERYRLMARIGMGGMGSVYKAEHVRMGKVVAVKLLHGDLSRDESMIRRFTREARAASRLSNPHTVSVFDYGQSEGLGFVPKIALRWVMFLAVRTLALRKIVVFVVVNANVVVDV